MRVKNFYVIKSLISIGFLCLAFSANAIEYSAPGNPAKIRVFEKQTSRLVCFSFNNFCDLPAGEYTVRIFNTLGGGADSVIDITLEEPVVEDPIASDTLANLNCSEGEIAKFIGDVWSCAEDLDTGANVFDTVASLEALFCTTGEILMRDPNTSAIRCVPEFECPASPLGVIEQTNDRYVEQSNLSNRPGECVAIYTNEIVNTNVFETRLTATVSEDGDSGTVVRRISNPVSVSTSTRVIDNFGDLRACALLFGCTNF